MTVLTKHKFQSAKGDGTDATLVRPSNWNDDHNITMASGKVLGRLSAAVGAVEELPVTSYMMNLLNTADYAALAVLLGLPTTGDAKLTYKLTADAGWILANDGSIGDVSSGGTTRANADTQALFTFFYNNFADGICPVQTSAGGATTRAAQGTATVAYNAHCRMVIPKLLGRALIFAGTGAGLTNRVLGNTGGEENHLLSLSEIPSHQHTFSFAGSGSGTGTGSGSASVSGSFSSTTGFMSADHLHNVNGMSNNADRSLDHLHSNPNACQLLSTTGGGGFATGYQSNVATGAMDRSIDHLHGININSAGVNANHNHTFGATVASSGSCTVSTVNVNVTVSGTGTTDANGGSGVHNNMQPWTAWNIMIRL